MLRVVVRASWLGDGLRRASEAGLRPAFRG